MASSWAPKVKLGLLSTTLRMRITKCRVEFRWIQTSLSVLGLKALQQLDEERSDAVLGGGFCHELVGEVGNACEHLDDRVPNFESGYM